MAELSSTTPELLLLGFSLIVAMHFPLNVDRDEDEEEDAS